MPESAEIDEAAELDLWLAQGLMVMPDEALKACLIHIRDQKPLRPAYGWPDDHTRAMAGNIVGISFSKAELEKTSDSVDLRWLAEEVFCQWCLQFVDDAHMGLPRLAVDRLTSLLKAELEVRR